MKVLQLTQRFPPAIGGVENHVFNLASKLTETGIDVDVFATDSVRDIPFRRLEGDSNDFPFKVRRFRAVKLAEMPHGLGIVAPSMIPNSLSSRSDLVHAHSYGYFATFVGALARKIRKIPLVITTHSDAGRPRLSKRLFDTIVPPITLWEAQRIIALTESEEKYLTSLGVPPGQIVVIPNGIDLREFPSTIERAAHGGVACVLFVGRLYSQQKGLEILIQALSHIHPSMKFQLNIVGEDWGGASSILDLAKKLGVEDRIKILGRLSRNELLRRYASADLFVLPSLFEPFGIALLEAMASGLPVVASRVGGIPEVIEEGKTGLLVPPSNAEELGAAIERLLSDEGKRRIMGHAGQERAALFSWDLIVPRIRKVYEEAIAESAN